MAGKRKLDPSNPDAAAYPVRVYFKHNALHYVDRNDAWHKLVDGRKFTREAELARAKLILEEPAGGNKMQDMLNGYLKYCRTVLLPAGDMSERTIEDKVDEIANLIGFFGRMHPKLVRSHHVGKYKRGRAVQVMVRDEKTGREKLVGSRTQCNHELSTLSSAFAWGLEEGLVDHNPVKGIRRWKVRPRNQVPKREDANAFYKWAREQGENGELCAIAHEMGYLTAQRKGDSIRIRLSAIDEAETGGITFLQRKGKETVEVTVEWTPRLWQVYQDALAWRRQYRARLRQRRVPLAKRTALASPWLFCTRKGKPYTDQGFAATYGKVCRAYEATGEARVRWHDGTRARGSTQLKQDGRQAHEVTGHHTEATVERIYDRRKKFRGRAVE